jgi:hypothetical protein
MSLPERHLADCRPTEDTLDPDQLQALNATAVSELSRP